MRLTHKSINPVRAGIFGQPLSTVGLCVLLAGALFGFFRATTFNEYEVSVYGDASYYAEMTQALYLGERPVLRFPTMHSRRILGALLAAKFCSLTDAIEGRKNAKPFRFNYLGGYTPGKAFVEAVPTYKRVIAAWNVLDAAAFVGIFLGLFGILRFFQLQVGSPAWQPVWLAFILCCSPTLGRLYVNWPLMNDLAGISLGLLSVLCLLKKRALLSGLLFGAGMLARENLALIYPCFLWILFASEQRPPTARLRKTWLLAHLLLSFTPYVLLCTFPVFRNVGPLMDDASRINQTAPGAAHDYLALIFYHLLRPASAGQAGLRQTVVYWHVCGPLLFLAFRFYPWSRAQLVRDQLLWAGLILSLATAFYVDRYVVYAILPLALLARHSLCSRLSPVLAAGLSFCYLVAVRIFIGTTEGIDLQIEFMDKTLLYVTALWGACALVIVIFEPILRARVASLPLSRFSDSTGGPQWQPSP